MILFFRTVIVESFEPGVPMNHYLKSPHLKKDKRRLASLGLNAYLKMMLKDNFIHADLHPGKNSIDWHRQQQVNYPRMRAKN